uniref:Defensin-like protein n=1 Tax=Timema monikensis TaxID=170555 RepID=A0A7R9E0L8_9NEOP|nr:unnamed protein product [Timema monikensis]
MLSTYGIVNGSDDTKVNDCGIFGTTETCKARCVGLNRKFKTGDESQKSRSSRVKRSPCDGLTPSLSCKAHCLAEGKGFNVGRCVAGICLCIE